MTLKRYATRFVTWIIESQVARAGNFIWRQHIVRSKLAVKSQIARHHLLVIGIATVTVPLAEVILPAPVSLVRESFEQRCSSSHIVELTQRLFGIRGYQITIDDTDPSIVSATLKARVITGDASRR